MPNMPKILVIEDADPLRNDIMEMLSFENFEVRGAENGAVGVEMALNYKPDLIICDIMMPELNGFEVLETLRDDESMVTIPFIFLTAKTDRIDIRQGMGKGADDYLTKPFVAEELLNTINARLKHRETINTLVDTRLRELSDNIITALPHELRTPLNTIIGFSDMLIAEADRLSTEQVIDWSKHINVSAQRLYRLVENYLMYVKVEVMTHNDTEIQMLREKQLDHPTAIIEFHVHHKAQLAGRLDDLELALSKDTPIKISDHDLGKIIEEVIDNAFKFSTHGEKVVVASSITPEGYEIRISDQGRGMGKEQIDSIGAYMQFERWFYEQQGSGLGLAIVKRLVDLYDGNLSIISTLDKGTDVKIMLPLAN